jgi:putative transport protein
MLAHFLQQRPLLLLFAVATLGYFFGRLTWRGFSLGVAAVLFAGLLVGHALPGVDLPDFVSQLGLVLFVYTIGVASGPGFFASLRKRGLRDNALVLAVIVASSALVLGLASLFGLDRAATAGLFAGALTNTPALAAVVEALKVEGTTGALVSLPVVSYSLCYPLGVLVPLLLVGFADRWFGVNFATERLSLGYRIADDAAIVSTTLHVDVPHAGPAEALRRTRDFTVNFGRLRRGDVTSVVHDDTEFRSGDLVTVIGTQKSVDAATRVLGHRSAVHLEYDRSRIDYRRMFVSNAEVTERPLRHLHLGERYDAVVTRVRRGDVDLVPHARFELLLGDRVRVLAPKERLPALEKLFGDSLRRISELDVISFGLGITLGLLLGAVQLPSPGGGTFTLGLAGGPLVAGLILGRVGRTGSLVWSPPYGVNMTLRQFGVVLFLAGVGLKAGSSLAGASNALSVLPTVLTGAAVSACAASLTLIAGRLLLRIPLGVLVGILAGQHTQPAVLAFALERTGRDAPNVGYASVFPLAMIAKIVLAQLILHAAW